MINQEIAKIFQEISDFLEAEGVQFKPVAYKRASLAISSLDVDLRKIYEKGGLSALKKIPGIGESIALKIEEYLSKGKISYYEELRKKTPIDLAEIVKVEGVGPKQAKILYEKLGVKNLEELEKVAKARKISSLPGFGEKKEKNILEGIAFLKKSKGRFLLGEVLPIIEIILDRLERLEDVKMVGVAGSVRRMKETVGDVDILAVSGKPEKVMNFFVGQPEVIKVWGKGLTKSSVRLKNGLDVDLRVVSKESYGSALQYFTGSKEHNIATRKIAKEKGLKLNEYGVFYKNKMIAGKTEKEIYQAIGLSYIPPEIRENRGEIEASLTGNLPKIIGYNSISGDLHCHTNWDGGNNSIIEMVDMAREMGYKYIGISDHTKFLKIEHGLDEKQLIKQAREIEKTNENLKKKGIDFHILHGAETNILKDGSIDINDKALAKLDYAIAGVHSNMKMDRKEMTERIIRAMKNPYIKIIAHPTGRIIKRREAYKVDFEKVLRAAKEFKVALEINSSPERLDLNGIHIKMVKEAGVKMVINTDAHQKGHLTNIKFGIGQARRGWAEKKDIINAWPLDKLLKFFK